MERFTAQERAALEPYVTNLDRPVFALVGLPEVVKGALFARYSRSAKSLRRLFLDEFHEHVQQPGGAAQAVGVSRAEALYDRVFLEYGDDSVAQLGGAHVACEGVSNLLTKVLERGRLAAYLEQSTRYVPYTDRPDGRWKYHVPAEVRGTAFEPRYAGALDRAFATYAAWLEPLATLLERKHPREADVSAAVHRRAIRAKALDALRGLLPAATESNVGIFATGQAWEALLLRLRAHPLAEARGCGALLLDELRRVIPAFVRRVDQPERGGRWSRYLAETREATAAVAGELLSGLEPRAVDEVTLTDFDPDGEIEVVAAALYAVSRLPDAQLRRRAREMTVEERTRVLEAYVGERANRRHKPGRAFERTSYRFDILSDYGAFRDLQRHRLLTIEWQSLTPDFGYHVAEVVAEAGALPDWTAVMDETRELYHELSRAGFGPAASYVVPLASRLRYVMEMNAREAMHVIELRTAAQGHAAYRRVCQAMHRLIAEQAGHRAIAAAMRFADHEPVELERLAAERAAERRRGGT
jgi:thymidylate synthase ThyX